MARNDTIKELHIYCNRIFTSFLMFKLAIRSRQHHISKYPSSLHEQDYMIVG